MVVLKFSPTFVKWLFTGSFKNMKVIFQQIILIYSFSGKQLSILHHTKIE